LVRILKSVCGVRYAVRGALYPEAGFAFPVTGYRLPITGYRIPHPVLLSYYLSFTVAFDVDNMVNLFHALALIELVGVGELDKICNFNSGYIL
jgi:hypothetical protein